MQKRVNNLLTNILIYLSILGIIISSYLLYLHYAEVSSFCDFSPSLSCEIVNKSRYSEFPPGSDIPVSGIGILTFVFILINLILIKKDAQFKLFNKKLNKKFLINLIFYILIISIIFALYLVYTELFLILSICILCIALDIIILTMFIIIYKLRSKNE